MTLENADPARLQSIYAYSDTLGIQKLTVAATDSRRVPCSVDASHFVAGSVSRWTTDDW